MNWTPLKVYLVNRLLGQSNILGAPDVVVVLSEGGSGFTKPPKRDVVGYEDKLTPCLAMPETKMPNGIRAG